MEFITREMAIMMSFFGGSLLTAFWTRRAGHGESEEPRYVAIQTRQDVGGIYASSMITNGLLAAILAALVLR